MEKYCWCQSSDCKVISTLLCALWHWYGYNTVQLYLVETREIFRQAFITHSKSTHNWVEILLCFDLNAIDVMSSGTLITFE